LRRTCPLLTQSGHFTTATISNCVDAYPGAGNLRACRHGPRHVSRRWITRIAMNEALGRLRKRRPTVDWETFVETRPQAQIIDFPVSAASNDPEKTMAQGEIRAVLEKAIDELPDSYRAVFVARIVEAMTVDETADLYGLKPQTVKTRLHCARTLLRDTLDKQLGPTLTNTFPFGGHRCDAMTAKMVQLICR